MPDCQESQTLQQLTLLTAKKLPNRCKNMNNLRTSQPGIKGIFKNSQLQINFTAFHIKKSLFYKNL